MAKRTADQEVPRDGAGLWRDGLHGVPYHCHTEDNTQNMGPILHPGHFTGMSEGSFSHLGS